MGWSMVDGELGKRDQNVLSPVPIEDLIELRSALEFFPARFHP